MRTAVTSRSLSDRARERMSRPLFHADWTGVTFLHYEVEPAALRARVPFPLDLREGRAYVGLVLFWMRGFHADIFAGATKRLLRPFSDHYFLNLRTYVRVNGEAGIYFLAEWLSNRLAVPLGGPLFGLPYHFGKFDCRIDSGHSRINVEITGADGKLNFEAADKEARSPAPCDEQSLDEFLLERYVAFTQWGKLRRLFRVWHEPWPAVRAEATVRERTLLNCTGDWTQSADFAVAHRSPGVRDVWMGRPEILK